MPPPYPAILGGGHAMWRQWPAPHLRQCLAGIHRKCAAGQPDRHGGRTNGREEARGLYTIRRPEVWLLVLLDQCSAYADQHLQKLAGRRRERWRWRKRKS